MSAEASVEHAPNPPNATGTTTTMSIQPQLPAKILRQKMEEKVQLNLDAAFKRLQAKIEETADPDTMGAVITWSDQFQRSRFCLANGIYRYQLSNWAKAQGYTMEVWGKNSGILFRF